MVTDICLSVVGACSLVQARRELLQRQKENRFCEQLKHSQQRMREANFWRQHMHQKLVDEAHAKASERQDRLAVHIQQQEAWSAQLRKKLQLKVVCIKLV